MKIREFLDLSKKYDQAVEIYFNEEAAGDEYRAKVKSVIGTTTTLSKILKDEILDAEVKDISTDYIEDVYDHTAIQINYLASRK